MVNPVSQPAKVSIPREPSRCQKHAIAVAKQANSTAKSVQDVLDLVKVEFDISDRFWDERVLGRILPPETPAEVKAREEKEKSDKIKEAAEAAEDAKVKR
jgi:hypothetical protein